MQGNQQDGYGGVPWMCTRLYLVPHQVVKHFTIDHSHPYTNKAHATYVMLARYISGVRTVPQTPL